MYLQAYSLLDTKTGMYSLPWFMPHEAIALRAAQQLGNDKTTNVGQYPDDFVLFNIGEFDDNTALMSSFAPRSLGTVGSLLVKKD
ncbi:MAG: nonstructural protein [Microvirus sp.]|nr:MAG: nonstructural protein [Microvirus sp.]